MSSHDSKTFSPDTNKETIKKVDEFTTTIETLGTISEFTNRNEKVENIHTQIIFPESLPPKEEPVSVILSLHGQGSSGENNADLFEKLRENGSIIIVPTTSRRTSYNPETSGDYETWMQTSFKGKDYTSEVEDFEKGINSVMDIVKQKIGSQDVNIALLGFSLGGTMATTLSEKYPIQNLILVAPALSGLNEEEPLIGKRHPEQNELLEQAHKLDNVTVIRGDKDPFIPKEDTDAYAKEGGTMIQIPDAGHTFGKLSFLPGDEVDKRKELIDAITNALA